MFKYHTVGKMKTNQKVIVLASDENYAIPLCVTIYSIIESERKANESSEYQFVILISNDFPDFWRNEIQNMLKKYHQLPARFEEMQNAFENEKMVIDHITQATYYRLLLPSLLKEYDSCLYLDVDIVACESLHSLFEEADSPYYLAGVKAPAYYYPVENAEKNRKRLKIEQLDQYVNAGVLLMNLKKMREDHLEERFCQLLEEKFPSQDQDILNSACYGKIKTLHPKYNMMTKYPLESVEQYDETPCLGECFTKDEWKEALVNPVMIHYADEKKPWMFQKEILADKWWTCYEQFLALIEDQHELLVQKEFFNKVCLHRFEIILQKEKDHNERYKRESKEYFERLKNADRDKVVLNEKLKKSYSAREDEVARMKQAEQKLKEQKEQNKELKEKHKKLSESNKALKEKYAKLKGDYATLNNKRFSVKLRKLCSKIKKIFIKNN